MRRFLLRFWGELKGENYAKYTREEQYIRVCSFSIYSGVSFRAYLAPRILHALASTRLKKAKITPALKPMRNT